MNILFTGATGNLYTYFNYFLQHFKDIPDARFHVSYHKKTLSFPNHVNLFYADYFIKQKLNLDIQVVIHSADIVPYNHKNLPIEFFKKYNTLITQNLFESLPSYPSKIIYFSTNLLNNIITDELDKLYAISKINQEKWLNEYCNKNNITLVILRLPVFIRNINDFSYDLAKINSYISIFPFKANRKVLFISSLETFYQILKFSFFVQSSCIVNFKFNKPFNYSDKIKFLKTKLQSKSITIFFPLKKLLKNEFLLKYNNQLNNIDYILDLDNELKFS